MLRRSIKPRFSRWEWRALTRLPFFPAAPALPGGAAALAGGFAALAFALTALGRGLACPACCTSASGGPSPRARLPAALARGRPARLPPASPAAYGFPIDQFEEAAVRFVLIQKGEVRFFKIIEKLVPAYSLQGILAAVARKIDAEDRRLAVSRAFDDRGMAAA